MREQHRQHDSAARAPLTAAAPQPLPPRTRRQVADSLAADSLAFLLLFLIIPVAMVILVALSGPEYGRLHAGEFRRFCAQ